MDAPAWTAPPGARVSDYDVDCVDNHWAECGEFEAECLCYDETDAADDRLHQERDEEERDVDGE